ncbi:MAG: hypothetical protein GEU96_20425 [Propionibacteriales bacterium]|nr:hypothetical protein [Propionibacteriales bacterium]
MTRRRSGDLWAGLAVAVIGGVGLWASFDIFVPTGLNDFLGPRAFPITVSSALVVLGLILSVRAQRSSAPPDFGSVRVLSVVGVAVVGYLAVFELVGFFLATTAFLAAMFVYLGEARLWLAGSLAVVLALAVTLGFSQGLNVALPTSPLGF